MDDSVKYGCISVSVLLIILRVWIYCCPHCRCRQQKSQSAIRTNGIRNVQPNPITECPVAGNSPITRHQPFIVQEEFAIIDEARRREIMGAPPPYTIINEYPEHPPPYDEIQENVNS